MMFTPKTKKAIALFLCFNMLNQLLLPTVTWALTSGPSQPEVQSFEPVGTTDMVDLSSGDFNYNIPLLDVEGYPINIAYHSGVNMDQEATWVGLGWNLNVGTVNRNMRGLPDDFKGDEIERVEYTKPNYTVGVIRSGRTELFALNSKLKLLANRLKMSVNASRETFYNSYRGFGSEVSVGAELKLAGIMSLGSSVSHNSQNGIDISGSAELSYSSNIEKTNKTVTAGVGLATSINSRTGLFNTSFTNKLSLSSKPKDQKNYSGASGGVNGNSSYVSYNYGLSIPSNASSTIGIGATLSFDKGFDLKPVDITVGFRGYFNTQKPENDGQYKAPAYGYLYANESTGNDYALQDYTREKEVTYSPYNPYLPLANQSYDLHTVTGQGIGGMFRAYRGEIGIVGNRRTDSKSYSGKLGPEAAWGVKLKKGVNINYTYTNSSQKRWTNNNLASSFGFAPELSNSHPNPFYFKQTGEKTRVNETFLSNQNISDVLRPAILQLSRANEVATLDNKRLIINDGDESQTNKQIAIANTRKLKKEVTNNNINVIFNNQLTNLFQHNVFSPGINLSVQTFLNNKYLSQYNYNNSFVKPHHISIISTTSVDGRKYTYGIPAYNKFQQEISFTIPKPDITYDYRCDDRTVGYNSSVLSDKKGKGGIAYDGYYNETKTPAFAHSYLLTSVLSPDYIDINGNSIIDEEDHGNYTIFNYSKTNDNYKWRTPMTREANRAGYNKGLHADEYDDKASIVYGEKEVWHLHSVESRNYIAVFTISARKDGKGAAGIHGGIDLTTEGNSYKLDKITLYNKEDIKTNGINNATPVKVVHFDYSYELCPKTVNNVDFANSTDNGKLTLKSIHFTYGKSQKGALSKYVFTYGEGQSINNPNYNTTAIDRWGTNSSVNNCSSNEPTYFGTNGPNADEFPYTLQLKLNADRNAKAWLLSRIELPSGGRIDVNYEADDYAYVQDKQAMTMCMISGLSTNGTSTAGNYLYQLFDERLWVHIKLPTACPDVITFNKNYLPNPVSAGDQKRYLYYSFYTRLFPSINKYEYIRGYAEIDFSESQISNYIKRISDTEYAVKVKSVRSQDTDLNSIDNTASPFAKNAWQYFRMALPQYAFPGSNNNKGQEVSYKKLQGKIKDVFEFMIGVNNRMLLENYANQIDASKSFVKIRQGTGFKFGGGSRVKSIQIIDNWNLMSTETNSVYGQEYEYTTIEDGRTISSGVASYEPGIGNDENPFRTPIFITKKKNIGPDEQMMMEEPFGESFFPSAGVTYSKVKVKNIIPASVSVKKNGTGYVINEFYTTKDFPTITKRTPLKLQLTKPNMGNFLRGLLFMRNLNFATVAQGYQIELNDMNGKQKAVSVYAEPTPDQPSKLLSRKEYFYKTDPTNPKRLDNRVTVIEKNGLFKKDVMVGVETDMVMESNIDESEMSSYGSAFNLYAFPIGAFPMILPIPLPSFQGQRTANAMASMTRVVYRFGILESTKVWEDNATIIQTNLAFDEMTGEALYTKVDNEYKDPVYNITYPAHWVYPGMSQASETEGRKYNATIQANPLPHTGYFLAITTPDAQLDFMDFIKLRVNGVDYYTYYKPIDDFYNNINVATGGIPSVSSNPVTCEVTVIRSGRNNLQSTPVFTATTLSPLFLPNVSTAQNAWQLNASHQIINAQGTEFDNIWPKACINSLGVYNKARRYKTSQLIEYLDYFFKYPSNDEGLQNIGVSNNSVQFSTNTTVAAYEQIMKNIFFVPSVGLYLGYERSVFNSYPRLITSINATNQRLTRTISFSTANPFLFRLEHDNYNPACHNKWPSGIELISEHITINESTSLVKGHLLVRLTYQCGSTTTYINGKIDFDNLPSVSSFENSHLYLGEYLCLNSLQSDIWKHYNIWLKKKDYLYLSNRVPLTTSSTTNQRNDGTYETFSPLFVDNFVRPLQTVKLKKITSNNQWKWTSDITAYHKFGNAIEAKDPLNIYGAAFTNKDGDVVISAKNARLEEVGFDGFEDKFVNRPFEPCLTDHFYFSAVDCDSTVSHSGKFSGKITDKARSSYTIKFCSDQPQTSNNVSAAVAFNPDIPPPPPPPSAPPTCPTCLGYFAPHQEKTYVISGWVRIAPGTTVSKDPINAKLEVIIIKEDGEQTFTFYPKGPIIEGWQKVEGEFTIPQKGVKILFIQHTHKLTNGSSVITWMDDFRVFPKGAVIKTYAYNIVQDKLMAEHDENNFTTFYEYDEQGALKRVKKETERGIMTLKESRNHQSIR